MLHPHKKVKKNCCLSIISCSSVMFSNCPMLLAPDAGCSSVSLSFWMSLSVSLFSLSVTLSINVLSQQNQPSGSFIQLCRLAQSSSYYKSSLQSPHKVPPLYNFHTVYAVQMKRELSEYGGSHNIDDRNNTHIKSVKAWRVTDHYS